ncbi:glutamate--cysteine ligase [Embleya sp. NPDC005971]|uniref:carboxylate-amine ligase n=1 Tax=Embleya sp. NPDC005971 TaxID=3156724 RepID=UPI00340B0846
MGVEEEYFLVDPADGTVATGGSRVLARARGTLGDLVSGELTEYQIEAKTPPCAGLGELAFHLARMRAAVVHAAGAEGLAVAASGTPILGAREPVPIRPDPRYRDGLEEFRALNDTYALCALHVHVHVPDREHAVLVSNHLRPWLPTLVAMAANSPFWAGRDSGYASWRTIAGARWPVSGPPPYFFSLEHHDQLADTLRESGAALGERTLFWDVRPCAHLPTVEIRAMDVTADVDETAALAVLVRALVLRALERVRRGDPGPPLAEPVLRAAYWRSARDGWSGHGLDPCSGRLLPAATLVRRLRDHALPVIEALGELPTVTAVLDRQASAGGGAERQRAAFAHRRDLRHVADHLVAHTARPGEAPTALPHPDLVPRSG